MTSKRKVMADSKLKNISGGETPCSHNKANEIVLRDANGKVIGTHVFDVSECQKNFRWKK